MSLSSRPARAAVLLALCLALPATAADWNQWRGPDRDGVAGDFAVPKKWPRTLTRQWQVKVGQGHSSPVVAGGKLFQLAREGDDEVVLCLDPATGKRLWRQEYRAPYEMHPAATGHGKGPKATPAVHDGRLYTFGISGVLSCWDAATGRKLWQKEFSRKFKTTSPLYGAAASPLIDKGLCIVHVGGHDDGALMAFDATDGEVKWESRGDGPGYASPVVADLAGRRQVVTQTQRFLLGVAADTGALLWRIPFTTAYDQNSVTPFVYRDLVVYSGYDRPTAAVRVVREGGKVVAKEVWKNREQPQYMSTPVGKGELLFGMSHRASGRVFCLDTGTGRKRWQNEGRMGDNVALVRCGDVLLLLTTRGRLVVASAASDRYEALAEYEVSETPTWAHPCPAGKRLFVKDFDTLTAWSVGE